MNSTICLMLAFVGGLSLIPLPTLQSGCVHERIQIPAIAAGWYYWVDGSMGEDNEVYEDALEDLTYGTAIKYHTFENAEQLLWAHAYDDELTFEGEGINAGQRLYNTVDECICCDLVTGEQRWDLFFAAYFERIVDEFDVEGTVYIGSEVDLWESLLNYTTDGCPQFCPNLSNSYQYDLRLRYWINMTYFQFAGPNTVPWGSRSGQFWIHSRINGGPWTLVETAVYGDFYTEENAQVGNTTLIPLNMTPQTRYYKMDHYNQWSHARGDLRLNASLDLTVTSRNRWDAGLLRSNDAECPPPLEFYPDYLEDAESDPQ